MIQKLQFIATFLLAFLTVYAQVATTGKITGVVVDTSGAAVTNARIDVESSALMTPRTVISQADGNYLVDLLPIGSYQITVTAQ